MPAAPRRIAPERLPRVRAAAQLLHRPGAVRDPAEVARAICGAQAQDLNAGPLSFRSRCAGLSAAEVDRARTEERSLLRTWCMRRTIHLIPADDSGWLLPLFEPGIERWSRRRLGQLGVADALQKRALSMIGRSLAADGPMTRGELAERIVAGGIDLDQQRRSHVIGLAVTSGLACLGPDRGRQACLVLREDWLGDDRSAARFDRDASLAELARRYLRGFGPATDRDMARWSGLGLGECRAGLAAIAAELLEEQAAEETMLSLKAGRSRLPRAGRLRLLPAFDTYMLGWASRGFSLDPERDREVNAGGGIIHPTIVEDGTVTGTWRARRQPGRIEITMLPFAKLDASRRKAIDAEVAEIGRFERRAAEVIEVVEPDEVARSGTGGGG